MNMLENQNDVRKYVVATKLNERQLAALTREAKESNVTVSSMLAAMVDWLDEPDERERISQAVVKHTNLDGAARSLGLSRKGLYHKRKRLGLLGHS